MFHGSCGRERPFAGGSSRSGTAGAAGETEKWGRAGRGGQLQVRMAGTDRTPVAQDRGALAEAVAL